MKFILPIVLCANVRKHTPVCFHPNDPLNQDFNFGCAALQKLMLFAFPLMVSNYESREISFRGRRPAHRAHRSTFLTLCRQTTSAPRQRSVFPWGFFFFLFFVFIASCCIRKYIAPLMQKQNAASSEIYLFFFIFFTRRFGLWGPGIHSFRTLMYWFYLSCGLDDLLRLVHDSVGRGERKKNGCWASWNDFEREGERESSTLRPPLMSLSQQK